MSRFLRSALLSFAVVLVAGSAALADSLSFGSVSGPDATFGAVTGSSYSQPGSFSPYTATGAVVGWEATTASFASGYGIKGSYLLATASSQKFTRTTSIPSLTLPITWCGWVLITNTTQTNVFFELDDDGAGGSNDLFGVWSAATTGVPNAGTQAAGTLATATASAFSTGTWYRVVAVWKAANDRYIYTSADTTGGNNTTSLTPSGIDRIRIGSTVAGTYASEETGPQWLFCGTDWSGAGNATARNNFLTNGCDPESSACLGINATARWLFDNAATDSRGSYDLTATNSPTAQNKVLALYNRVTANPTYVARATASASAPTWSASAMGGVGGAVFASASSQFLVCSTTPVTAAPLQAYCAALSNNVTAHYKVVSICDSSSTTNAFALTFKGDTAGDPVRWSAIAAVADTSSGYSASTVALLWGLETSSTSRSVEINGSSTGTDTTSATPASIDRIGLGYLAVSAPGNYLDGEIGFALLMDTASTTDQAAIEAWSTTTFGAP